MIVKQQASNLDVVPQDLPVPLSTSLSKPFASLASSSHSATGEIASSRESDEELVIISSYFYRILFDCCHLAISILPLLKGMDGMGSAACAKPKYIVTCKKTFSLGCKYIQLRRVDFSLWPPGTFSTPKADDYLFIGVGQLAIALQDTIVAHYNALALKVQLSILFQEQSN